MVKINFLRQKTSFFRPYNIFLMKKILFGQIATEIFAFNGKNNFLGKN